jgi:hypothetical protein
MTKLKVAILLKGCYMEKKFKELYQAGEIEFEDIDEYTEAWGFSDADISLREYLGLNASEEDAWISIGDEALQELLDKCK